MTRPITNEDGVAPRGEISALRRAVLVSVSALLLVVVTLEMSGSGSGALNRLGDAGRPVWLVSKSDEVFQSKVDEQVAHLEKSEEIDEEQATAEGKKGVILESQAERECQIAQHLQDNDMGLEKRARRQREAATSLQGRAAELLGEAEKEHIVYLGLTDKGGKLKEGGQSLLSRGASLVSESAEVNGTLFFNATVGAKKADANATRAGWKIEGEGGTLLAAANTVDARGQEHLRNEQRLRAAAAATTAASGAALQLGERFERRAVSHRLKALTARSKCAMMRAKAESAYAKEQDEEEAANELKKAVAPTSPEAGSSASPNGSNDNGSNGQPTAEMTAAAAAEAAAEHHR